MYCFKTFLSWKYKEFRRKCGSNIVAMVLYQHIMIIQHQMSVVEEKVEEFHLALSSTWKLLLLKVAACSKYSVIVLGLKEEMQSFFFNNSDYLWRENLWHLSCWAMCVVRQSFSKTPTTKKRCQTVQILGAITKWKYIPKMLNNLFRLVSSAGHQFMTSGSS